MGLPPKVLKKGITDMVRISDARMSGTAYGTVVLHAAPEAAVGGPLALVRDGDMIELDVAGRRLHSRGFRRGELASAGSALDAAGAGHAERLSEALCRAGAAGRSRLRPRFPRRQARRRRCRGIPIDGAGMTARSTTAPVYPEPRRTASSSSPAAAAASAKASSSISARRAPRHLRRYGGGAVAALWSTRLRKRGRSARRDFIPCDLRDDRRICRRRSRATAKKHGPDPGAGQQCRQ